MAKVTIVIPTYNVEAYIRTCLDSLVNQTSHDFTALVINDGSPANEQVIIDEYTAQYPYIKSIQKPNGGYGSVLNAAIQEVNTPYFLICDPDDYLRDDAVELLIKLIESSQADMVIGAKTLVYSDNQEVQYDPSFNPDFAQLRDGKIYQKGTPDFDQLFFVEPSPHAKLYRFDLVKKIHFPERVSYTDNVLYYVSLLQATSVTYTQEPLSNYLINREGNTRTDLRPSVMDAWMTVLHSILDQSQFIHDIPAMFYYRMFESFKFVFTKIDAIQAEDEVIREKLLATQSLLNRLLPHQEAILSILNTLPYPTKRLKKLDLGLLNPQTSDRDFHAWADYQLNRKLLGKTSLKQRVKRVVQNNPLTSKLFSMYVHEAKYLYALTRPKVVLHPQTSLRILDPKGQTFFGYYTRSPYRNGHYVYHRISSNSLRLNQTVEIVLDGKTIATSKAWNWQQGTLLQWVDDQHIIFNDYRNQHYVSVLLNIESLKETRIDFPIYSVSSKGDFALSLNFKRLAKYRPDYGYFNESYDDVLDFDPKDGIYWVDLVQNTSRLWISFEDLVNLSTQDTMQGARHKVNHLDISETNTEALFLHRWFKSGVKYTRLIEVDIKTKTMTVLADHGMVSHCAWNQSAIIAYLEDEHHKSHYVEINATSKSLLENCPDDGHPSLSTSKEWLVTDSYPNYKSMSTLYLASKPFKLAFELAQFYSGRRYKGTKRCDLHPRFSPNKAEVTLDTVYQGKRQLVALDLSAWEKST